METALRTVKNGCASDLLRAPIALYQQDRDLRYTWLHTPQPATRTLGVVGKTDFDLVPPMRRSI